MRYLIALLLLTGCALTGCSNPDTVDEVVCQMDGRTYSVPQLMQEVHQLRKALSDLEKHVQPSTVCACQECKCDEKGKFIDLHQGWSRLCQCETAKKREAEEYEKIEPDENGSKARATLIEIRDVPYHGANHESP